MAIIFPTGVPLVTPALSDNILVSDTSNSDAIGYSTVQSLRDGFEDYFDTVYGATAGSTNLSTTYSPTDIIVQSDTGSDATILLADTTNAGLLSPTEKTKLANTPSTFATVATTGDYNDLSNKPSIPTYDGSETKVTAGTNVTVTGTGTTADPYIITSTVSGTTTPVMGGAGTSTTSNIGSSYVTLSGTYTSDGGSTITATGWNLSLASAPLIVVATFSDTTLTSPITATATGLTANTAYIATPYATNAIGTSNGVSVSFSTLQNYIFVANNGSASVVKVDKTTYAVFSTYTVGSGPRGLYSYNGFIYSSNFSAGSVSRIEISTGTVTTISTGAQASEITRIGTDLYCINRGANTLSKIDIATFAVTATLSGFSTPSSITTDGTSIYISNSTPGTVIKVNPAGSMSITSTSVVLGGTNGTVAIYYYGGFIFVSSSASNQIYRLNSTTLVSTGSVAAGGYAYSFIEYGGFLYAVMIGANYILKIDPTTATPTISGTLTGFNNPVYLSIDGTTGYITNAGGNTISIVDMSTFSITSTGGTFSSPWGIYIA